MIESKKELVVIDNNLSSASTKRNPFHLLSSIFGKKKSSILENEVLDSSTRHSELQSSSAVGIYEKHQAESDNESIPRRCSTVPQSFDDGSGSRIDPNFLSPVATARRKNLKIDLETLHLSRQDNPYLKQLERFSLPEETILSCADFNSLAEKALLQSEWQLDSKKDVDIHQHLVRSPPPNFPQNITHFIYSQANSPKRQINETANEDSENHETDKNKKVKSLNPVQTKKETGVLDPGIREVLEYQKSQLIAGIQHSLSIGQAKFGTAPAHYVPVPANLGHNSQNSQARWTQDSGSRFLSNDQAQIPQATSSLPLLASSYFELDQTCKKPLGPIRIGRTLSDSICHDNQLWKNGEKQ